MTLNVRNFVAGGTSVSALSSIYYTVALKAAGASRRVFQLLDSVCSMPESGKKYPMGGFHQFEELKDNKQQPDTCDFKGLQVSRISLNLILDLLESINDGGKNFQFRQSLKENL